MKFAYLDNDNNIIKVSHINTLDIGVKNVEIKDEDYFKILNNTELKTFCYVNKSVVDKLNFEKLMIQLRILRNDKLREKDFLFFMDTNDIYPEEIVSEAKINRQYLRDITNNLNTVEDVLEKINEIK